MSRNKEILIVVLCIALSGVVYAAYAWAISIPGLGQYIPGLPFGGNILYSHFSLCTLGIGIFRIPIPIWLIAVGNPKPLSGLGMVFPLITKVYAFYMFFRTGPETLGTYLPFPPNPILLCPGQTIILKIGTSLF
jgi:hypothetical protein